jgi:hypothetical protein
MAARQAIARAPECCGIDQLGRSFAPCARAKAASGAALVRSFGVTARDP